MSDVSYQQIILTHWNAGVFRPATLPQIVPELVIYALLYDEVLIREEDLITNAAITQLFADENNFAIFSQLLSVGLVKLLRLPLDQYPRGRQFDPVRLPISARVEEHQVRRSYKGHPWNPTRRQWQLFRRLDDVVAKSPLASRFHAPFPAGNPFAKQLAEVLGHRDAYRLKSHRVFRYLSPKTAAQFEVFCHDNEAWQRFLHEKGVAHPIVGPDGAFYRSAAYQCAEFLPTPRAVRRLVESVYAATYCEREAADGRYGGSDLVELPYRYSSERERASDAADALRVELVPTDAAASIVLDPSIVSVLMRTRESTEFKSMRRTVDALGVESESPLLEETRFRDTWRRLAAVYAEHAAMQLQGTGRSDHKVVTYTVYAYVLARMLGLLILPAGGEHFDAPVGIDHVVVQAIEKLGPRLLRGFRSMGRIPALQEQMERSLGARVSTVPLSIPNIGKDDPRA